MPGQILWQKQAIGNIKKLNRFFELGYLHDVSAAAVFQMKALIGFVLSAQQEVVSFLKLATRKILKLKQKIKLWWMCVRNEYQDMIHIMNHWLLLFIKVV